MIFGLTAEKLLIITIIAVFLVGPDRLPLYASKLAKFVAFAKSFAGRAKDRMRNELGPDFDDVDWQKLDPRQYDPRRIIRAALEDELVPAVRPAATLPTLTIATISPSTPLPVPIPLNKAAS